MTPEEAVACVSGQAITTMESCEAIANEYLADDEEAYQSFILLAQEAHAEIRDFSAQLLHWAVNDRSRHRQQNPLTPRPVKPSTDISIHSILGVFLSVAAIDKPSEIANINLESCSVHL